MINWDELTQKDTELANFGLQLIQMYKVAYLATVRKDGAPRVHPVSPQVIQQHMLMGIKYNTPKYHDLMRDKRYVLHALPGENDAEFYIRGQAIRIDDPEMRAIAGPADGSGVLWNDEDTLFELLIEQAYSTYYEINGQDAHPILIPIRHIWPSPS